MTPSTSVFACAPKLQPLAVNVRSLGRDERRHEDGTAAVRWLYYLFIYRRLMMLAHRFNWHHTRTCFPDGDTLVVCDWCGLRQVVNRVPRVPYITTSQSAAKEGEGK